MPHRTLYQPTVLHQLTCEDLPTNDPRRLHPAVLTTGLRHDPIVRWSTCLCGHSTWHTPGTQAPPCPPHPEYHTGASLRPAAASLPAHATSSHRTSSGTGWALAVSIGDSLEGTAVAWQVAHFAAVASATVGAIRALPLSHQHFEAICADSDVDLDLVVASPFSRRVGGGYELASTGGTGAYLLGQHTVEVLLGPMPTALRESRPLGFSVARTRTPGTRLLLGSRRYEPSPDYLTTLASIGSPQQVADAVLATTRTCGAALVIHPLTP